ncbi:splicing factor, proline- and glutamine-rich-like isoform X3 [Motacilla alba alba]|uniref:splicing factor, proline- and glutamine-rich-like isoform X3 n=1 Tax=Motacilla alba alba TaxID=1094192 RepID=UPI0018D513B0|nr:splicing factor, proline- and glutamine-rich-like isoform X3 [Motacilla alba alba]
MPVKGSAPCPTMPGPPRSRLRQAPFGLTVAPLQESLEDFLTPVAPGKHRPLAPPSAGSGPAPAPNEAPPAAPPAAASLPPGSRPVPGSSPGASLVRAPPLVSSAAGPWLPVPGERARCCPQGGEKPRLDQLYRERRLRQRLLRDPTHRRRPAKRRGRVGLDGGGRQAAGGEPSLAGGHQASVPGSHLGVGAAGRLHLVPRPDGVASALSMECVLCKCCPCGGASPSRRMRISCRISSSPGSRSPESGTCLHVLSVASRPLPDRLDTVDCGGHPPVPKGTGEQLGLFTLTWRSSWQTLVEEKEADSWQG